MIRLVISGGQNGVDLAALRAAKQLGIPTGGFMPKGFRTLDGPRPEYAKRYGMQESPDTGYPTRTRMNVEAADFTLQIFENAVSPGEVLTRRCVRELRKPTFQYDLYNWPVSRQRVLQVLDAIPQDATCINVAGNSERTCPGIGKRAYPLLLGVFQILKDVG
jgi:hypothetical protein